MSAELPLVVLQDMAELPLEPRPLGAVGVIERLNFPTVSQFVHRGVN